MRRAWLDHLLRLRRLPDGGRFDAVAWRGALAPAALEALEGIAWPWRIVAEAPTAFVDLAAVRASGRPYLDHVSANTRRQVRRAMALYEERYGPLRLDAAGDVGEALAFFHAAGALHQARWQPRGKPGAFAYPFYVRFHERLIKDGLPEGVVELVRVCAGEVPIGYLYNFLYHGRVYYYFSGFRYEADNRLKPGLVSHTLCIERHLARGMDVYDFMAGDNRYKTSLGQPGPRMISVLIERPTPRVRLEYFLRRLRDRWWRR
ncbi:MAG: GNAT family N-acetyltransferase [Geminicoccaceae bacterium]